MANALDHPFCLLSAEVKLMIFAHLDYQSLCSALKVCKEWNLLIDDTVWRELCIRDWKEYLEPPFPLSNDLDPTPMRETTLPEPQKGVELNITNWEEFYRECLNTPNLNGIFSAIYGDHGKETLEITHKGFSLSVLKVTGDPHVPAGKISWYATLCKNRKQGWGQIQVAEYGYLNPSWRGAHVTVVNKDQLDLTWFAFAPNFFYKDHHRTFTRNQGEEMDQEESETDEEISFELLPDQM
jgi:hypothetical protein